MRTKMQIAALLALGWMIAPTHAQPAASKSLDEQSIAALEDKASHAQAREQCFLYAELVNQMTMLSARQYAAGDVDHADGLLKRIQAAAARIHLSLAANDKRLKNAEILLSKTVFRLNEMLHSSDYDDRQLVKETLASVNDAQDEAMKQVFKQ